MTQAHNVRIELVDAAAAVALRDERAHPRGRHFTNFGLRKTGKLLHGAND
jgi:hypothetical protein